MRFFQNIQWNKALAVKQTKRLACILIACVWIEPVSAAIVGATKGEFGVNQGTANYSMKIDVPPGEGGMQPEVGLNYSSNGGNGYLGVGWSLSGISAITRCAQTKAQDGEDHAFGVKFNDNDRFCLNGQRLINIQGDYGVDGTEYRTEIDTYSKIISYGRSGNGPNWFKVYTKSGLIYEYGREDAALIAFPSNTKRFWKVKRISDRFGHTLEFTYIVNNSLGIHYITKIANGDLNIKFAYENRPDVIKAYQAGKPFQVGVRLQKIITSVGRTYTLSYDNDPSGAKRSKIVSITEGVPSGDLKTLSLDWSSDSGTEPYDATPYDPGVARVVTSNQLSWDTAFDSKHFYYTELNGDGAVDICSRSYAGIKCFLNDGHGKFPTEPQIDTDICAQNSKKYGVCNDGDNYDTITFRDMDADGLSDLVYRSDNGIRIWKGTGKGFGTEPSFSTTILKNGNDAFGNNNGDNNTYIYYPELNGDGVTDMCYRSDQGIKCYLNDGSGHFSSTPQINTSICDNGDSEGLGCNSLDNYSTIRFMDMDADGLSDLVYRSDDGIRIWKSSGSGFSSSDMISTTLLKNGTDVYGTNDEDNTNYIFYPELNGDGAADMCYRSDQGIKCYFNDGSGHFKASPQMDTAICANGDKENGVCDGEDNYATITFADINLDGLSDLVYRSDGGVRIWRSEGTNFESYPVETEIVQNDIFKINQASTYSVPNKDWRTLRFADMNGDGALDVIYRTYSEGVRIYHNREAGSRITRFDNGVDQDIKVTYEPLTTKGLHTNYRVLGRQSPFGSDDIEFTPAVYVVSSVDTSDGIGDYNTIDYKYEGYGVNKERGSLGFSKIFTYDNIHKTLTQVKYLQTFPYIGVPFYSLSKNYNGHLLKWSSVAYKDSIYYYGVDGLPIHQPYTYMNSEHIYEPESNQEISKVVHYNCLDKEAEACSDAPLPTVEAERGVGNVLKSYTATSGLGGGSNGVVYNYYESGKSRKSNWLVGRLSRSKATKGGETHISKFDYMAGTGILTDEWFLVGTDKNVHKHYTYDADGYKKDETVTAEGKSRTTSYVSGRFGPETITNPMGYVETRTYDARFGTLKTISTEDGRSVSIRYDDMGRKVYEKNADGTVTTWDHKWSSATSVPRYVYYTLTSSNIAPDVYTFYDAKGRETLKISSNINGQTTFLQKFYNEKGELYKESLPYLFSSVNPYISKLYDTYGRLKTVSKPGPSGTVQVYSTSYYRNTTTVTDPRGNKKYTEKNALGKVIKVIDAYGTADASTVSYQYYPTEQLHKTISANGTITLTYDIAGNKDSMIDPDLGEWSYHYDAWGDLVEQWGPQSETVNLYDKIGRLKTKTVTGEDGSVDFTEHEYEEDKNIPNFGKLIKTTHTISGAQSDATTTSYAYNALGCIRQQTLSTRNDGSMRMSFNYDGTCAKVTDVFYPNGYKTTTHYKNGYAYEVVDGSGSLLYRVDDTDGFGHITDDVFGNWVRSRRIYDQAGYLANISAGKSSFSMEVQSMNYEYDEAGNTILRMDERIGTDGLRETFTYDALDRMRTFNVYSNAVGPYARFREYRYNAAGDITYRTGGRYGVTYDKVGNIVSSGNGRTYKYTPLNKPYEIRDTSSGKSVQFFYGADQQRYKKVSGNTTSLYMGKYYELERQPTKVNQMAFIYFGGKAVGRKMITKDYAGRILQQEMNYYHTDALGSIAAVTGGNGNVLARRSYEPFGEIRAIDYMGTLKNPLPNMPTLTTRTFTGHEQITEIPGLIHMNGRVYDSTLGRFLSADPHIQAPDDSQSYNRYSYVRNNPLKYTDPSGYSWFSSFWKKYGKTITAIVITAVVVALTGGAGGILAANIIGLSGLTGYGAMIGFYAVYGGIMGAVGGFVGGALATGTMSGALTGAAWGALGGAVAGGIGGYFGHEGSFLQNRSFHEVKRAIVHGLSRGAIAQMQGQKFNAGFWSGFAASAFNPGTTMGDAQLGRVGGFAARTTMAATVGGTASELGGGKFANGAVSGAFVHMFNHEAYNVVNIWQDYQNPDDVALGARGRFGNSSFRENIILGLKHVNNISALGTVAAAMEGDILAEIIFTASGYVSEAILYTMQEQGIYTTIRHQMVNVISPHPMVATGVNGILDTFSDSKQ